MSGFQSMRDNHVADPERRRDEIREGSQIDVKQSRSQVEDAVKDLDNPKIA